MSDQNAVREAKVKRLQQNLASIRKIARWTAAELGDEIGVTKQTISNLENEKTPMNYTQYLAIRAVLSREEENTVLQKAVELLVDCDELEGDEYSQVQVVTDTIAASTVEGVPLDKLGVLLKAVKASLPIIGGIIAAMIAFKPQATIEGAAGQAMKRLK